MTTPKSRGWCFTLNNYTDEDLEAVNDMIAEVRYCVYGKETGESGTPHLQGFVLNYNQVRMSTMKTFLPRAHWEIQRGTSAQAIDYCKKDGDFSEFGEKPTSQTDKGAKGREAIAARWRLAKEGKFEELPPEQLRIYKFIYDQNKPKPATLDGELTNVWIYGPAGSGKSTRARELAPDAYIKMPNKWWDGYNDETDVIIEDMDADKCKELVNEMKVWCDRFAFRCEVKGGSMMIRPKRIIVSANYAIDECFTRIADVQALKRRFTEEYMGDRNENVEIF